MKNISEKKLLIIAYYLPPTKTVATVRIFNFHLEAQKYFKEIFSITTSNRQLFPADDYDFDDKKTTEIWTYDLRRFLNKKNNMSTGFSAKTKSSRFAQLVSKLVHSFPFNIFLADGGLTYILGGFFKGKKLIRENNIEVIFSSYKPYADHLICFLLKKWNPKLVWIADFRDLHVDEIRRNILFPNLQKWFNRRVLKNSDVVTTVSNGLGEKLKQYNSNIYILRNGIPTASFKKEKQDFYKKFTVAYTGSIYPKLQTAELLFQVLEKLILDKKINKNHLQLIYAGKESAVWNEWIQQFSLQEINTSHGFLPKEKAQEIQQRSHVNLLLSWSSDSQKGILTAKFYDYLLAQNPILLIIKGTQDEEFEQIFDELNAGVVAYHHADFQSQIEHFILEKYKEWAKHGNVKKTIHSEKLEKFRWDTQMEQFVKHLNSQHLS